MKKIKKDKQAINTSVENKRFDAKSLCLRAMSLLLCACIALIACFGIALIEVLRLKGQTRSLETDRIRIYIDQGHNPTQSHNSGAEGNGLYEQDVTFAVGCMLAELLEEDGRFEVRLSRPDESTVLGSDTASSLKARVDGATDFNAEYFISLHVNSYTQDTANGIEVFVSGKDSESYAFGSAMLDGMLNSTGLNNRGMKQGADLYVLKNADMPAALLEMGFISNSDDAALLADTPELFARGIYNGILEHFESAYTADINILILIIGISSVLATALMASELIIKKRNGMHFRFVFW